MWNHEAFVAITKTASISDQREQARKQPSRHWLDFKGQRDHIDVMKCLKRNYDAGLLLDAEYYAKLAVILTSSRNRQLSTLADSGSGDEMWSEEYLNALLWKTRELVSCTDGVSRKNIKSYSHFADALLYYFRDNSQVETALVKSLMKIYASVDDENSSIVSFLRASPSMPVLNIQLDALLLMLKYWEQTNQTCKIQNIYAVLKSYGITVVLVPERTSTAETYYWRVSEDFVDDMPNWILKTVYYHPAHVRSRYMCTGSVECGIPMTLSRLIADYAAGDDLMP